MGTVVGINYPKSSQEVNKPDPSIHEARVRFVQYMAKIAEQYLNGDIEVVVVGYADQEGRPCHGISSFPVGLENDLLALGVSMQKEATEVVLDYHAGDKESV